MNGTSRSSTLMHRILATFGLVAALSLVATPPASADQGDFGLGIIIGEPTGISFKNWVGGRHAVDAAAAWSFVDEGAAHIHADYLWHFFNRFDDVEGGRLPFYVGIGGRVKFNEDDALIGVRIPVGLDFILEDAPLDIFLEVVPILDLAPDTDLEFNAALGVRFWFGGA